MSLFLGNRNQSGIASPRKPLLTRSITVEREGPNRPEEGRLIPWPAVPCYPTLSQLQSLHPRSRKPDGGSLASLFSIADPLFVTAGRIALGRALQALSLEAGDKVLIPAYHCLSMVEPLQWFGLEPRFYKVQPDLTVDFADLEAKLDRSCRALVAVHYFGFAQDGAKLRDFCDTTGLFMIEDCAHAFFGSWKGQPLGSFGDFAIGSLTKFFPVSDGGCLVSARRAVPQTTLRRQGGRAELAALIEPLQRAHYYDRLPAMAPLTFFGAALGKAMALLTARGRPQTDNPAQQRSGTAGKTERRWLEVAICRRSLAIARTEARDDLVVRRRANYQKICAALAGVPGLALLKPALGPETVPYMVPLRIDNLRRLFARMEDGAIPMQRFGQFLFDGVDETVCPVSADLSHHGVQIPCHQDLRPAEIDWMIAALCAAIERQDRPIQARR